MGVLNIATGVIGAVGAFLTIYFKGRIDKAKIVSDRGEQELAGVKVSVDSLEAALVRSDAENARLRADLAQLRLECRDERRVLNERVSALSRQVVALGGDPT